MSVLDRLTADSTFQALVARLAGSRGAAFAEGLWGSFAPMIAGQASVRLNRPLLYITAHLEAADEVRDDLELFLKRGVEIFAAWETLPGEGAACDEIAAERIRLCSHLHQLRLATAAAPPAAPPGKSDIRPRRANASPAATEPPPVIVTPIQALMQPVPTPEALEGNSLALSKGQDRDPRVIAEWLVNEGFTRLDLVESPGDFALRGSILDIYPLGHIDPIRVEFFGDTIEGIRQFDVSTQRSMRELPSVRVASVRSVSYRDTESTTNVVSYLPADTLVCFDEPTEIQELGRTFMDRLGNPIGLFPVEAVFRRVNEFGQLHLVRFGGGASAEDTFRFNVQSVQRFETKANEAVADLCAIAQRSDVYVYSDNAGEQQRLRELIEGLGTPASAKGDDKEPRQPLSSQSSALSPEALQGALRRLHLEIGLLHRGFEWVGGGIVVVGHHEIFHRYQRPRRIRRAHAARPIESWLDLDPGDLVVHIVHGIARFRGMKTQRKGETDKVEEYLTLEFADKATLHVSATQIDLVQKYIGAGDIKPSLSKVGGTRWKSTKEKVEEAVSDLAAELLKIHAVRASQPGIAYPADTEWQREFEEAFIYTETEDQLTVLGEIKEDMGRPRPMDRLLCGDVGYGKTELAMRAAFKVVEFGKQVAVLVPTTVLAEQHYRTFTERMAGYPFTVDVLSRFRSRKEQDAIIDRAKRGHVDVIIGTHRLLSRDVGFSDLGLVVIDEEQRFGVEHKERLKRFRETVDVLTLTATPIPRTLHMSMLGIRDISSLATPPMDRRSIVTQVRGYDRELIRDAVYRELNRDGQVYFVNNFVSNIQSLADELQQIVPDARIVIGHGQMHEHELERSLGKFLRHEADILVCTNIIESGVDIPNANTIFINRADRFGLADLHQLRGRVGRYKHRAYCYLLLTPGTPLTSTAAKRLKAIEEYSDLGAGFRIAMRDLEIRGAGNILGPEQSGHIAEVGYELYCQLLDAAVRRLKGEALDVFKPVHLELQVPAHVPRSYIPSDRQRMEVYRRLAAARVVEDVTQLERDLKDAYGPYPETVDVLLQQAEVRILAQPYGIVSIVQKEPDLIFTIRELAQVQSLFARAPGSPRVPDATTVHLRLAKNYFSASTMLPVLRRMLAPEK